ELEQVEAERARAALDGEAPQRVEQGGQQHQREIGAAQACAPPREHARRTSRVAPATLRGASVGARFARRSPRNDTRTPTGVAQTAPSIAKNVSGAPRGAQRARAYVDLIKPRLLPM